MITTFYTKQRAIASSLQSFTSSMKDSVSPTRDTIAMVLVHKQTFIEHIIPSL